jgi:PAS domain S-box-containing protein
MVKNITGIKHQTSKFRQVAEEELRKRSLESSSLLSEAEIQKLIYELQVHQIELEMMIDEQENSEKDLRESELRYRSLYESSSDAIYAVDEKGQYQFTNHLFASIYGETPVFFVGKTFWDIYDKDHADSRYATTQRVFSTGKSESVEYEVTLSDKTLYFLSTSNPVKDETGKIVSILTHSSDITSLKRMQTDLAELNRFNSQILDSVQDGIIVYDQNMHFKVWNPFMVKISGIPASQVLGKHPSELFQSSEFPFLYEADVFSSIDKVLNGEPVEKIDFPYSLPENGKSGWTSYKSMPLRDSHGEITGVIGIIHDITERKRTEKYFEEIIDKNPLSIQIVDKEGFTLKGNDAFCKLFGSVPPSDFSIFNDFQLKGKGFGEIIELIKKGEVVHFPDMPYNVRDSVSGYPDVPAWIRTVVFPLMDSSGKPEKFVFMHENIMERKQAEEALENEKQRLSSILHGTSAGTWEWNIQTGETIYNELWAGFIGYTLEELSPVSFDTWIKHCHTTSAN